MEIICASVAYIRDTNFYNKNTIKNLKKISIYTNVQNKTQIFLHIEFHASSYSYKYIHKLNIVTVFIHIHFVYWTVHHSASWINWTNLIYIMTITNCMLWLTIATCWKEIIINLYFIIKLIFCFLFLNIYICNNI